jgi:serine/threonine protein kinase/tetratricopeptide (TPR) repeat protein
VLTPAPVDGSRSTTSSIGLADRFARARAAADRDAAADADVVAQRLFTAMPGTIGRHRLVRRIGSGGGGVVYEAVDTLLGRRLALKLLHMPADPHAARRRRARIEREARALACLGHPNVIAIYDVGSADDTPYLATELVAGTDFSAWLRARPRSHAAIVAVILQAAQGLAAAHGAGLVHRDVKPSNILVGDDGRTRVADFGLARTDRAGTADAHEPSTADGAVARTTEGPCTEAGALLGTPAYMAPEQRDGGDVDGRADIYSLCVTLFEAIHGVHPFAARRPARHDGWAYDARRLVAYRRLVPMRLAAAIERGLETDPALRWPSMAALVDELQRVLTRRRWRLLLLLPALAAGSLLAVAPRQPSPSCDDVEAEIQSVWNDDRRRSLVAVLDRSAAAHATTTERTVVRGLDDYRDDWRDVAYEACAATRSDPARADELANVRACLGRRAVQVSTLLDEIDGGDVRRIDASVDAVTALPPPRRCMSRDAASIEDGEPAWMRLDHADVLRQLGELAGAEAIAREVLAHADSIGSDRLRAEAGYRLGHISISVHDPRTAADVLSAAHWAAQASGTDEIAASTAADLMLVHDMLLRDRIAGSRWRRHAESALARIPAPSRAHGEFWFNVATCHREHQEYSEMLDAARRAAALDLEELGAEHPATVASSLRQAEASIELGRFGEANRLLAQIARIQADRLGALHPARAHTASAQGLAAYRAGDFDTAVRRHGEAIAIKRAAFGEEHPETIAPSFNLAQALFELGEYGLADRQLADALPIAVGAFGPDHPRVGVMHAVLAKTAVASGELERAGLHAQRAASIIEASSGRSHIDWARVEVTLAEIARARGRLDDAGRHWRDALAIFANELGDRHMATLTAASQLASVLLEDGNDAEAIRVLERAAPDRETPALLRAELLSTLGVARLRLGERAGARPALEAAVASHPWTDRAALSRAEAAFGLARALPSADDARAVRLAELALAQLATLQRYDEAAAVRSWLARRARRASPRRSR